MLGCQTEKEDKRPIYEASNSLRLLRSDVSNLNILGRDIVYVVSSNETEQLDKSLLAFFEPDRERGRESEREREREREIHTDTDTDTDTDRCNP